MTKLMENIRAQAGELAGSLEATLSRGREALEQAARIVRAASTVYITGIGSSWHAGMAVQALFRRAGRAAVLLDASELLHFASLPADAALIVLSRSGQSVEIVESIAPLRQAGARIVAVTNTPGSPLGRAADVTLPLYAAFDHNISITMYTALTLVGGLLAERTAGALDADWTAAIRASIEAADTRLDGWIERMAASDWFAPEAPAYFLARGASLASCHETRLLWEEAAKAPASALGTGGFRHGPQEVLAPGLRIGLWVSAERLRDEDIALARDLATHGARVLLVGCDIPNDAAELVLDVPPAPPGWSFLVDVMPGQVAAERLARLRGVDCDTFRLCPYIVTREGGLTREALA